MYLQYISRGIEEASNKTVQVEIAMISFKVRSNSDITWTC